MCSYVLCVLGISSVYLDVDSGGVKTSYQAKGGLSIIDSQVDGANLVSSSLERLAATLPPDHTLSALFSQAILRV
jgi:hypothetical protein